ncbi:hypothetical protein PG997_007390 [Apiospora hydei]|uniref:Uncharacterized protein n=1 Tax=Apiospora hydei TaxID=1337664 RepID=A0ABR1W832_9PEZI
MWLTWQNSEVILPRRPDDDHHSSSSTCLSSYCSARTAINSRVSDLGVLPGTPPPYASWPDWAGHTPSALGGRDGFTAPDVNGFALGFCTAWTLYQVRAKAEMEE